MNSVLDRIAQLQARFVAPQTARVAGTDGFSSALASARRATDEATPGSPAQGRAGTASLFSTTLPSTAPMTRPVSSSNLRSAYARTPELVPDAYHDIRDEIDAIAAQERVPSSLLAALVWSESGFDPDAVSSAGARGLAQLMPATAEGLGVNIDDPQENLRGGARYLRQMLDRFGRVDLALAAYNAGPNAVARANGIPPYEETQTYVTRVLARAATLAGGKP